MQIQTEQGARNRKKIIAGVIIYSLMFLLGAALLFIFLAWDILSAKQSASYLGSMITSAFVAGFAVLCYLMVPVIIDRYDPEPWWALLAAFAWGAVVSCGFAGMINTFIGAGFSTIDPTVGDIMSTVVSAPVFEELFKGMLVAIMFFFLRSEFDGVVDGVIYATFTALGFAAMENVLYYARGDMKDSMAQVVIIRGFLSPWCHPLFTSMTGIGFGIAREAKSTWVKFLAPIGGYLGAVALHACWNGTPTFVYLLTGSNVAAGIVTLLQIAVFAGLALAFTGLMIGLVIREGRIIRKNLHDEMLIGTITQQELDLVCSPWGRMRAMFSKGGIKGRKFVGACATLALKKWHTARAVQGKKMTVSMDFIVPLRQEIARIKAEIAGGVAPAMQPAAPGGYAAVPGMPAYMPPGPQPGYQPMPQQQAYPPQQQAYPPQQQAYPPQQQAYPPQQQAYPPQQQAYPPQQPGYPAQPWIPPGPKRN